MKRFLWAMFLTTRLVAGAQQAYFQQEVAYNIAVQLDDAQHRLTGTWRMTYTNRSDKSLEYIWMHLWANAYSNRRTAYARQQALNGKLDFFDGDKYKGGYSDVAFRSGGKALRIERHPKDVDVVKVWLAEPLSPGQSVELTTELNLQIPYSTSRLGHVGQSYQMTQWYPKPAVYDHKGWHPMPYLEQGEFYSEFGRFDVRITLPANYVVGATGMLQNADEMAFLEQKAEETRLALEQLSGNPKDTFPPSSPIAKTLHYVAHNVHDFAWFADKRFYVLRDEAVLPSGKRVPTWAMFTNEERDLWKKAAFYVKRAVEFYSENVGEYPYPHATAVMSALSAGSGMEYPMITVIGNSGSARGLDIVITHEVGHNWFYGILASNERDHPWMDEGMNSYYEQRYTRNFYGNIDNPLPTILTCGRRVNYNHLMWELRAPNGRDQAPDTHSAQLESLNYGGAAYMKPAQTLYWLEQYLGTDVFDKGMKAYYQAWQFKHPYPEDFRKIMAEQLPGDAAERMIDTLLLADYKTDYAIKQVRLEGSVYKITLVNRGKTALPVPVSLLRDTSVIETYWVDGFRGTRTIEAPVNKANKVAIDPNYITLDLPRDNNYFSVGKTMPRWEPLKLRLIGGYDRPDQNRLYVLPLLVANKHDGWMPMLGLYNAILPTRRFNWALFPSYSIRQNALRGVATASYQRLARRSLAQGWRIGAEASTFGLELADHYRRLSGYATWILPHAPHTKRLSEVTLRATEVHIENQRQGNTLSDRQLLRYDLQYNYKDPHPRYSRHVMLLAEMVSSVTGEGTSSTPRLIGSVTQKIPLWGRKNNITMRLWSGWVADANRVLALPLVNNSVYDLGFDNFFLGRYDYLSTHSRQLGQFGAGLRVPFNQNLFESRALAADRAAVALNLFMPVPYKRLSFITPYFDIVHGINKNSTLTYWSGGLSIDPFGGAVRVNFPLVNSNKLKSLLPQAYGRRITFTLDIPFYRLFNGSFEPSNFLM